MKNKILAAFFLLVMAIAFTSCYSTRRSGCPGNPTAATKFKG